MNRKFGYFAAFCAFSVFGVLSSLMVFHSFMKVFGPPKPKFYFIEQENVKGVVADKEPIPFDIGTKYKPVVTERNSKRVFNGENLKDMLIGETSQEVRWYDNTFTLVLGDVPPGRYTRDKKEHGNGSLRRSELLNIAKAVQEWLPDDCPFRIEVQTLEDALKEADQHINNLQKRRDGMIEIHGEQP